MQSFRLPKNRPVNLTQEERNIYSLIARQYLMQFCPDAEYRKSKITLNIAGGTFIAQARNLQTAGWKRIIRQRRRHRKSRTLITNSKERTNFAL